MDIRLIVMDVDGVLTDGKLYIGNDGTEFKTFNVKDGMGISLAKRLGIKFALISGRDSYSVTKRAKELNIDYIYQGINDKKNVLKEIISLEKLKKENIAFIGDDINDLIIFNLVGITFCPSNAANIVKNSADVILNTPGGEGVVREMIDYILNSRFNNKELLEEFLLTYNLKQ